jgi:autophagy-related protein 17
VLEALGTQLVPPEFHTPPAASEVFGAQLPEDKDNDVNETATSHQDDSNWEEAAMRSPATVRGESVGGARRTERARWRTLRDFVDERGIEEVLERMDEERNALEV